VLVPLLVATFMGVAQGETASPVMNPKFGHYVLDYTTPTDPRLQAAVAALDVRLRAKYEIGADLTSVGVLDLNTCRLALVRPDRGDYAASIPKIAILLAWFQLRAATTPPDASTRHELGLMIKASDNALATKYSHGGGIWLGKHYGANSERQGDPVGDNSHAATVRQLLRFYLLLEQNKLVSPAASQAMREIFASPEIPHIQDKFVKGLNGRGVEVRRKAGWWETWFHDSAAVTGGGRHYLIVAMTHHAKGDDYLVDFAAGVDDLLTKP
jgi:beta-lactamase class A